MTERSPDNFIVPAEWERHELTWISWPNRRGATFPGELLEGILPVFHRLVETLVGAGETVAINLSGEDERSGIKRALSRETLRAVRFLDVPTNEPWCRDHGPTVLKRRRDGARRAVCWNYNSWGGKYPPWNLDAAAGERMAGCCGIETLDRRDLTLEGGSIESDGDGLLLISESSVVSESRNPGRTREELEREILEATGSREILWVNGEVPGDDTDGHVDCFARFAPDRVVLALDPHPEMSPSLPLLAANAARLRKWTEERNWRFLPLPIPGPVVEDGMVLPATYANFYVANRAVLLPSFNDSRDGEAASIVAEAFPGREVIPFPAKELIIGQGGIHCLTQPLPA